MSLDRAASSFLLVLFGLCLLQLSAAVIGYHHNNNNNHHRENHVRRQDQSGDSSNSVYPPPSPPPAPTSRIDDYDGPTNCLERQAVLPGNQEHMKMFIFNQKPIPIVLETSDRVTHQLVTGILYILLKEAVGYEDVRIHRKNGTYFTAREALERINSTNEDDIPESMINLEVWLSPGFNMEEMTSSGRIEDCGPLGPIGRAGWYIPKSVVEEYDAKGYILEHWRAFQQENVTKIFDLSEESNLSTFTRIGTTDNVHYCMLDDCVKGIYRPPLCHKRKCATILADYPNRTLSSLKADITSRNLAVEVAWVGPNLEKFVMERITKKKPVLFFNWKPNTLTRISDFVSVAFPHCEERNISAAVSPCEFEINQLEKVVWSKIKSELPEVYHLVRQMHFSSANYLELLDMYQEDNRGSKPPSPYSIACKWAKRKDGDWLLWIDPESNTRGFKLYIGGIFPMSGDYKQSVHIAAKMAIDDVNKDSNILDKYQLELQTNDGSCSNEAVMKTFIGYITDNAKYKRLIGILGPACSETVDQIVGVANLFRTLIISYSAEGSSFKNSPYFFRTIPENNVFRLVYPLLFKSLNWRKVAVLTVGSMYPEYAGNLEDGITFKEIKLPSDPSTYNVKDYLVRIKSEGFRIIIGHLPDGVARSVMCEAYKMNMTGEYRYQWFLPYWFNKNWYDTNNYNPENVSCTTPQMRRAVDLHMALAYKFFADDDAIMQTNETVREWRNRYSNALTHTANNDVGESSFSGFTYDAVWVYAKAVDIMLKTYNDTYRSSFHEENVAPILIRYVNETDFDGVSGRVTFNGSKRSRLTTVIVWQHVKNDTRTVAEFDPEFSNWTVHKEQFGWPQGLQPHDGHEVFTNMVEAVSSCPIETLRKSLGVSCEVAIVSANLMGFIMFALLVAIGFLFFKRRYEEKFKRIKELGLMGTNINKLALDEWEMARDHIVINRKLGEGAFGTVYGGEAFIDEKGWVAVAVKTLKVGADLEEKLDFLSEAEMMKRFDHSNIVKLLGVCTIGEPVYTVMEFMLYGDLKTYLLARRQLVKEKDGHNSDEISDRQLTNMALDIARGLSYLAEMKYVHRDLACRNCLVNANRTVKIGDFGMCRHTYDSDYYRFSKKGMLPVRWMAPESLIDGVFTPMSDVWSYAVLLYEIVTFGSFPYQGLSNNQVLEFVKNYNTLIVPKGCKLELETLFYRCWHRNPQSRPSASDILELLAHHPTLISPCLDLPLASVEVDDTNSIELAIHDRSRVHSITSTSAHPIRRVTERHHSLTHVENGAVALNSTDTLPLTFRTQVIPAKGQYVTLQCKNSQDSDYGSSASRDLAQGITAL